MRAAPNQPNLPEPGPRPPTGSSREAWLTAVVALHVAVLPWAFGGVDPWAITASAATGLVELTLLGWTLGSAPPASRATRLRAHAGDPALLAGVGLAFVLFAQWSNPAFVFRESNEAWWLEPRAHWSWLPISVSAPGLSGPLRTALVWFAALAVFASIRHGLASRRSLRDVLAALAATGFLIAGFGLLQRAAGTTAVFGVRTNATSEVFGSFLYRNHAATYLVLTGGAAMMLATYSFHAAPAARSSGKTVLYLLFAATALAGIVLTFSLGGTVIAAVIVSVLLPYSLLRSRSRPTRSAVSLGVALVTVVALIGGFAGSARLLGEARDKLGARAQASIAIRQAVMRQGVNMWRERALAGWGAGSFEFTFTKFQRRDPRLVTIGTSRLHWEHLHNDWLEFLIEFGILGVLPLAGAAGVALGRAVRSSRAPRPPALLWGVGALAGAGLHATFDFPFQNPAIVATAAALAGVIAGWPTSGATRPEGDGGKTRSQINRRA